MSMVKKIIIGVVITALVVTGATGGLLYMKKANQKEVLVTKVSGLASEYYMPDTSLQGNVTTNVSQNITLDNDMIIQEVYVQQGDDVKVGDQLISFDMTLVEMELNIAKLKHQKLQQDLKKAERRLKSLQNGGPIIESDGGTADNLGGSGGMYEDEGMFGYIANPMGGYLLAAFTDDAGLGNQENEQASEEPQAQSELDAPVEDVPPDGGTGEDDGFDISYQDPTAGDLSDGSEPPVQAPDDDFGSGDHYVPRPSPTPTPVLDDDTEFFDPYFQDADPNITDGEEPFYQKLDYHTEPFTGTGTEDDPYVFLCSSVRGQVMVTGAFFNRMAGYSEDGTRVEKEGGYWYQLEFHQGDSIGDYQDRKASCIGYYFIDGSLLEKPVNIHAELALTLEGASQYEDEEPLPPDGGGGGGGGGASISRKEAIKLQKSRIASLNLDIQESDINIGKLEKKLKRKLITSKLDGTVASVGDAITGSSDNGGPFITVKSKDGFYVKGTVSELMLDKVVEGSILNCQSWESGNFEAEVVEVSDYPMAGDNYFGYSDGNPNVSQYTFSALVTDKSRQFQDGEWINIYLKGSETADQGESIVLSKAFVRTEKNVSYVYKDDNGVLKKQILTVGGSVDGGYSVLIKGGITRDDLIAFPYGKSVQEGAKTKEASLEEIYGY